MAEERRSGGERQAQGSSATTQAHGRRRWRRAPLTALAIVAAALVLAAVALLPRSSPPTASAQSCAAKGAVMGLDAGRCAPNFTLTDLQGKKVSLDALRGRPVLLHFWAVACTTCRAEYPDFSRAVRTYTRRGLTVLAVDAWGEFQPMIQRWQNTHHLPALLFADPSTGVASMYHGTSTPTTYVIDRAGHIVFGHSGPLSYADFARRIKSVL